MMITFSLSTGVVDKKMLILQAFNKVINSINRYNINNYNILRKKEKK